MLAAENSMYMLIAVGVGINRSGGLWIEEVCRDGRRMER